MVKNDNFKEQKNKLFKCNYCDYVCSKHSDLDKHMFSRKHKKMAKMITNDKKKIKTHICICEKKFCYASGLSRHKKKCPKLVKDTSLELITIETKTEDSEDKIITDFLKNQNTHELIKYLLKENSEFKKILLEQNKNMVELTKQTTINNAYNNINSNNKQFNLQFFLNETCKDAMNITDFVSSIKLTLEDLETTGEKGYVEGISSIFIKNLNDLEQHLRPLHCSDSKREVIYIKDNDKWIKETNDKPILINAIKSIAHENVKQIKAWTSKYPDCIKPTSNKNDAYLRIVSNAMNGLTDEECLSNIKKIISFISKEVVIDKKMVGI
jgi:hypothetical protein